PIAGTVPRSEQQHIATTISGEAAPVRHAVAVEPHHRLRLLPQRSTPWRRKRHQPRPDPQRRLSSQLGRPGQGTAPYQHMAPAVFMVFRIKDRQDVAPDRRIIVPLARPDPWQQALRNADIGNMYLA